METFEALKNRASVREYRPELIEKSLLEKIVDAGRRAPSARGVEPWEFVAVTDKKLLQKLGELANTGSFIKSSSACIAVFCADTKYYLEDGCAATENILIAASALGLGACWVAGDKKPYASEVSRLLGSGENMRLISLISLGWPAKEARQKKTRPLKEVLHWNKF